MTLKNLARTEELVAKIRADCDRKLRGLLLPLLEEEFAKERVKHTEFKRIIFGNGTYCFDGIDDCGEISESLAALHGLCELAIGIIDGDIT